MPAPLEVLPVWFTGRMREDGRFGLLTTAGVVVCFQRIDRVKTDDSGAIWIDVRLLPNDDVPGEIARKPTLGAASDDAECSVAAATIVAAFELG